MKLSAKKRTGRSKKETNSLRREGFIPAILYVKESQGITLAVDRAQFDTILRNIKKDHLPNTVILLSLDGEFEKKVIVKEIQYDATSYAIKHLDFEELQDKVPVKTKIPVVLGKLADCIGIKEGGVPRQVIRHLKVKCLPEDIPECFELDVSQLRLKQSKRLSDIDMPKNVQPLKSLNEVAVVIVKR